MDATSLGTGGEVQVNFLDHEHRNECDLIFLRRSLFQTILNFIHLQLKICPNACVDLSRYNVDLSTVTMTLVQNSFLSDTEFFTMRESKMIDFDKKSAKKRPERDQMDETDNCNKSLKKKSKADYANSKAEHENKRSLSNATGDPSKKKLKN